MAEVKAVSTGTTSRRRFEQVEDESQFIIATHSPILLAYPRSKILQLEATGIREIAYEETEHYATTRYFLNNHASMVRRLMGGES